MPIWVQSLLAEANIETHILNVYAQGGAGELPFTHAYPELWLVRVTDSENVRNIIEKFENRQEPTGTLFCSQCGEHNPGSFEICWQCQTSLDN